MVRVFSGYWSDALSRRKPLVVLGYAMGAVSKLVFPLAPSLGFVVAARFVDRVGKGIRGAPRDALIADLTHPSVRGASFGLRQALDSVGAILGPLVAIVAIGYFAGDFRAAFWLAIPPAVLCVALLCIGVREADDRAARAPDVNAKLSWRDVRRLDRRFVIVTVIASVLTLARFSEAFLVLPRPGRWARHARRAMGDGGDDRRLRCLRATRRTARGPRPCEGTAFRRRSGAGRKRRRAGTRGELSGRAGRRRLVGSAHGAHAGTACGTRRGDRAPDLRGTAFGVFGLACGVALLVASALAGYLWQAIGPSATFIAGATFAGIAWMALALQLRDIPTLDVAR
jgi:predicted MFS family arabinose efflux permease